MRAPRPGGELSAALTALALLAVPHAVAADDEATASVYLYTDDDHETVVSPRARAAVDLSPRVNVSATYDADVITAATVDVRTSATPRGFEDVRHGGTLGSAVSLDRVTQATASVRGSTENDYDLLGSSLGITRDFRDRTVTLSAGWGIEWTMIGRSNDPSFAREAFHQRATAGLTLVLDPRTVLSAAYSLGVSTGYLSNPYRYVPIESATLAQGRPAGWVPENLPTVRDRHAVTVELRRALGHDLFVAGRVTGYADGWGVRAGTLQLEGERTFARDRWALGARTRGYLQSAASFHEESYDSWPRVPAIVSGDRELGAMSSVLAGMSVRLRVASGRLGDLSARAGADVLWFRYFDFAPLTERRALLVSAGLEGRL